MNKYAVKSIEWERLKNRLMLVLWFLCDASTAVGCDRRTQELSYALLNTDGDNYDIEIRDITISLHTESGLRT